MGAAATVTAMFVSPMDALPLTHSSDDEELRNSENERLHNSGKGTPKRRTCRSVRRRSNKETKEKLGVEEGETFMKEKMKEDTKVDDSIRHSYHIKKSKLRGFNRKNITFHRNNLEAVKDTLVTLTTLVVNKAHSVELLGILAIDVCKVLCKQTTFFKYSMPFLQLINPTAEQEEDQDRLKSITREILFGKNDKVTRYYYLLFFNILYDLLISCKNTYYKTTYICRVLYDIITILDKTQIQITLYPTRPFYTYHRHSTFIYYTYIKVSLMGVDKIGHNIVQLYLKYAHEHQCECLKDTLVERQQCDFPTLPIQFHEFHK